MTAVLGRLKVRIVHANGAKLALGVIWVCFATIFGYLALQHHRMSLQSAPEVKMTSRPSQPGVTITAKIAGMDIDQPLRDFTRNFNEYIASQNAASIASNCLSMWGYIVALATAAVSALIEFWSAFREKSRTAHRDWID